MGAIKDTNTTTTLVLSKDLREQARLYAESQGQSMGSVLRTALERFLKEAEWDKQAA